MSCPAAKPVELMGGMVQNLPWQHKPELHLHYHAAHLQSKVCTQQLAVDLVIQLLGRRTGADCISTAHLQAEDGRRLAVSVQQLARVDGVDDGARVLQLHAVADAIPSGRPPRVHKPE